MKKIVSKLAGRITESNEGFNDSGLAHINREQVESTLPEGLSKDDFHKSLGHVRTLGESLAYAGNDMAKPYFDNNPNASSVSLTADISEGFSNEVIIEREGVNMQTRMQTSVQYEDFEAVRQRGFDMILNSEETAE